jgi:hypothetical protein
MALASVSTPYTTARPSAKPTVRPSAPLPPCARASSGKSSDATAARMMPADRFCAGAPQGAGRVAPRDKRSACLEDGLRARRDLAAHQQRAAHQHRQRRRGADGHGEADARALRHVGRHRSARPACGVPTAAQRAAPAPRRSPGSTAASARVRLASGYASRGGSSQPHSAQRWHRCQGRCCSGSRGARQRRSPAWRTCAVCVGQARTRRQRQR